MLIPFPLTFSFIFPSFLLPIKLFPAELRSLLRSHVHIARWRSLPTCAATSHGALFNPPRNTATLCYLMLIFPAKLWDDKDGACLVYCYIFTGWCIEGAQ